MILESIYLKNYRIYEGSENISIANGDKNITIIQGNNDAGKTTLLNAITWCLYDVERSKFEQELYNGHAFSEAKIGEEIPVIVKLCMKDSQGRTIKITRSKKYFKTSENETSAPENEFTIFRDDGINDEEIGVPKDYIKTHLPDTLKDYFLFDGEELAGFFKKDNGSIKKDVFRLSQLNLLEKVSSHIESAKSEYLLEKQKSEPKYAELKIKEQKLNKCIKEDETEIKEKKDTIRTDKISRKSLKDSLDKFKGDPFKIMEEKDQLNKDLTKKIAESKNLENEYKEFLINQFSLILGYSLLQEIKVIGEDLHEQGFIPSEYKKTFLEYLLQQKQCICGCELTEGSEHYNKVQELCEKTSEITDISDLINQLLGRAESIGSHYPENFTKQINQKEDQKIDLEDDIDHIKKQIEEKKEILNNTSETDIQKIHNDIEYYDDQIRDFSITVDILEGNIKENNKLLKELEKDIKIEKDKIGVVDKIDKKIKFCEQIHDASEEIYEELIKSTHKKLQELTSKEFKDYHWKDSYSKIKIDNNFNVSFIKNDGTEVAATDPSAGTQLTLALSFITALNSLAGFELPIFIDTPLGRLDNDIRKNLGRYLPDYTKNKQVILLVTGNEYSSDFKENISKHVGMHHTLKVSNINGKEFTRVE